MIKSILGKVAVAIFLAASSLPVFADMGSCVYTDCPIKHECESGGKLSCTVKDACSPNEYLPELKIKAGTKIWLRGDCNTGNFNPWTVDVSHFDDFEIVPGVVVPSTATVSFYTAKKEYVYISKFSGGAISPCPTIQGEVYSDSPSTFAFLYGIDAKWHPYAFRLTQDLEVNDLVFGKLILARRNAVLSLDTNGYISEVISFGKARPLALGTLRCFK